jgi:hypothetical protein
MNRPLNGVFSSSLFMNASHALSLDALSAELKNLMTTIRFTPKKSCNR